MNKNQNLGILVVLRKVLVISYYYPPMGMGGVQRTAKFTKYLSRFGWQPHVITVNPTMYLASDKQLLKEVEESGVIIHRTGEKLVNNGQHKVVKFKKDSNRKLLSNISQTFLIPDSKVLWKNKAIALAEKVINENSIDLIYSTAPPYTDFLVAVHLKDKFDIPVILDYRDSWIDCPNNYYPTHYHRKKHMQLEKKVLHSADGIVTINRRIKELIIEKYPFVGNEKISVIPQGFDPEDFEKYKDAELFEKFTVTYSGSFLNYYTPKHFIDALKKIFDQNPGLRENIEALFIGTFPDEYKKYADKAGVLDSLKFTGYIEHSAAVDHLMRSHVLWMMINRTNRSDLHSTGKLYEYFGTGKPVIACLPDGVARESLKEHGAVTITEPDNVNEIADAVVHYYNLYRQNSLPKANSVMVSQYDRKKLAGKLAGIFDNSAVKATERSLS